MLDLTELKEAEKKATPGPWDAVSSLPVYAVAGPTFDVVSATGREYRRRFGWHGCGVEDAQLIALSRNLVPKMIEEIERLTLLLKLQNTPGVVLKVSPITEEDMVTALEEIERLREQQTNHSAVTLTVHEITKKENVLLRTELEKAMEALTWLASWSDGCPANSEYDKGLKAAHDALGNKATEALRSIDESGLLN